MLNEFIKHVRSIARAMLGDSRFSPSARQTILAMTPEEIAEIKDFFPLPKFFIFGHARSGTTLLARLIRLHPQVHCNWQAHFFTRPPFLTSLVADPEIAAWFSRENNRWNRGRDLSPLVLRAASDFIMERDARKGGKRIVGDKSPNNFSNGEAVRLLHLIYPDSRLIFMIRDGRDVVASHRLQAFIDPPQKIDRADRSIQKALMRDPQPFLNGRRSLFAEKTLRRSAENWARNVTETDAQAQKLFGKQYLSLRYEDLLQAPFERMQSIWAFLGADPHGSHLRKAVENELQENPDAKGQMRANSKLGTLIQKGKPGSWRKFFTQQDSLIFTQIAGKALLHWGYEKSLNVEPL